MTDDKVVFERFLALAKRELAATDVLLLGASEQVPDAENVVVARLGDGSHVVASFQEAPKDREALERRLSMLAGTFEGVLGAPPSERTRARAPVASSLHEELKALSVRARAADVVVIDADSPVIWGSAAVSAKPRARNDVLLRDVSQRELVSVPDGESGPLQDILAPDESTTALSDLDDDEPDAVDPAVTRSAVASLRKLSLLSTIHKGRHIRHVQREGDFYLALSFAGIYVLCLVFDGEFDELRAERAAQDALPRIARLVEALPPIDPEPQPMGGVIALRRSSRRR